MPATTPNRWIDGFRTAVAPGLSRAHEAFEVVAGGIRTAIARLAGWPRDLGHRGASAATARSLRSIGEAVRLATAPGEIVTAYRIVSVSRGRDRELWVVESRFGPR